LVTQSVLSELNMYSGNFTSVITADRAQREPKSYNAGLDERYRGFLLKLMYYFEEWCIARGLVILKQAKAPRVL
jgi:hypothetical protein